MSSRPLFSHKYDHLIQSLRKDVLEQLAQTPSLQSQVYPEDVERLKASDKWLMRFLEYFAGDIKSARDRMIASMKLQHDLKLREMSDAFFPRELWALGSMRLFGHDKEKRPVAYLRLKFLRKDRIIREMIKRFIGYLLFTLDQASVDSEGGILIADFAGLSVSNFNLDICLFTLSLKDKFPLLLKHLIILNVPYFASVFCNCTMRFAFPAHIRDMMLFLNTDDLRKHIDEDQIPAFLGGSSMEAFDGDKAVPNGAPAMVDFAVKTLAMGEEDAHQLRLLAEQQRERFVDVNGNS